MRAELDTEYFPPEPKPGPAVGGDAEPDAEPLVGAETVPLVAQLGWGQPGIVLVSEAFRPVGRLVDSPLRSLARCLVCCSVGSVDNHLLDCLACCSVRSLLHTLLSPSARCLARSSARPLMSRLPGRVLGPLLRSPANSLVGCLVRSLLRCLLRGSVRCSPCSLPGHLDGCLPGSGKYL